MALTLNEVIKIAQKSAGPKGLVSDLIERGEGRYVFEKATPPDSPLQFGDSPWIVVFEKDGTVVSGSSAPMYFPSVYEVIDFDGNVIRSREEVQTAWEAEKKRQAELDALAEAEGDEALEVVPVEWNHS
ncbi:hypothetical protein NQ015_10910 [Corynebacterium sp. 153RC1]|uniref:hypothetical protein n=1 Tax=unclassified Corynebacterium TaxID=2624378 RepID=UPI00211C8E59|nr:MULTISPECIES: hypothetical protein [unclassified Corynebacterium]MCQ9353528.1 hypothetical protein [Corynebacterium sp. 209RC1]MCQ9355749.1 hypothetical protein [Corynebacterium sp. 1222RC1]MCQ9357914.1 hypothetical protein [Corynebacterium sp. 122RC1]MCQ9360110.1 hypothetical protein [Corynebacterium sp. 142RC1]MCQ9362253.1 hypothetical protein [Corynebacterium sp. 153RC1]